MIRYDMSYLHIDIALERKEKSVVCVLSNGRSRTFAKKVQNTNCSISLVRISKYQTN